ncbi:hypothetical protein VIAG107301_19335 [Vibrio agarivorans]
MIRNQSIYLVLLRPETINKKIKPELLLIMV